MNTYHQERLLSSAQCERALELANQNGFKPGVLSATGGGPQPVNLEIRKCACSRITEKAAPDLVQSVYDYVVGINQWGFELVDEPPQLEVVAYQGEGHFLRHTDWGGMNNRRKISVSVQLSSPDDYEGCDLVLHDGPYGEVTASKERGVAIAFPSWTLHEVTPLISGERFAMVAWFLGPQSYR
jgi:PKHD-type hydroxylase